MISNSRFCSSGFSIFRFWFGDLFDFTVQIIRIHDFGLAVLRIWFHNFIILICTIYSSNFLYSRVRFDSFTILISQLYGYIFHGLTIPYSNSQFCFESFTIWILPFKILIILFHDFFILIRFEVFVILAIEILQFIDSNINFLLNFIVYWSEFSFFNSIYKKMSESWNRAEKPAKSRNRNCLKIIFFK